MKTLLTGIFLTLSLIAAGQDTTPSSSAPKAQNPMPAQAAPSSAAQSRTRIAPGSVIPVELTKSIDAKKVKTGDEVQAEVTKDLKAEDGEVIVPKNTKVVGRVTESQPRNKEQKGSQVGIAFDHAVMKNGGDVSLPMSIQAIIAPSYLSGGNSGGSAEGTAQPSPGAGSGGMAPGNNSNRSGVGAPQAASPSASTDDVSNPAPGTRQPITGNTQGVLGIPDLKLSSTADGTQGSIVSSQKNNVKLDGGTLLLLRVNQYQ
jgi:hypothetical protein